MDGICWSNAALVESWIVVTKDRTVQPELQRFVAKLMGATSYDAESSHVPMLSNSALVIHVIRTAAESIAKSGCDWLWKRKRLSGNQGVGKRSWD